MSPNQLNIKKEIIALDAKIAKEHHNYWLVMLDKCEKFYLKIRQLQKICLHEDIKYSYFYKSCNICSAIAAPKDNFR